MKELSAELRKAQEYENKALKEENENKFPVFHLKVPTGWMNDPNGFSVYKGEYHLFFQYNPYSRDWGSMHWGHVSNLGTRLHLSVTVRMNTRHFGNWSLM